MCFDLLMKFSRELTQKVNTNRTVNEKGEYFEQNIRAEKDIERPV